VRVDGVDEYSLGIASDHREAETLTVTFVRQSLEILSIRIDSPCMQTGFLLLILLFIIIIIL
jgi:hypothetical protein